MISVQNDVVIDLDTIVKESEKKSKLTFHQKKPISKKS